jgi:tetratricopeptide (TPR) repeat protein
MAHNACAASHRSHGDFRLTVEHVEASMPLFDIERERLTARMLNLSACVSMYYNAAASLWMLGFPERSRQFSERCSTLAREIDHPPSIEMALAGEVLSRFQEGDAEGLLSCSAEAIRLGSEERLGFWEPYVIVFQEWALSKQGDRPEAVAQIRGAIERYSAGGNGLQKIVLHAVLAGVEWEAGAWNDAFETLATGMKLAKDNAEGHFEPELYRLQGEFLLAQATGAAGPPQTAPGEGRASLLNKAERCIRDGLQLARRQDARMLELRSLASLCRVRRELGSVSVERAALAEVYAAFTEGFETPDLQGTRAMLETL